MRACRLQKHSRLVPKNSYHDGQKPEFRLQRNPKHKRARFSYRKGEACFLPLANCLFQLLFIFSSCFSEFLNGNSINYFIDCISSNISCQVNVCGESTAISFTSEKFDKLLFNIFFIIIASFFESSGKNQATLFALFAVSCA